MSVWISAFDDSVLFFPETLSQDGMLVRSTGAKDLGGSVWVEVKFQGGYLDVPLGLLGSMVMGSVGYNPKDPNIQTIYK